MNNKPKVHFSHANGLPASTYRYLFELLTDIEVCYIEKLGHGELPFNGDWFHLADELIVSIEQSGNAPVIGVGHSLGAVVTLLAATKRPELFSQVILLDPVLFSKRKRWPLWVLKKVGLGDWVGPIKRTLQRRYQFDHSQQAFDYFKSKALFRHFHPRCFADYIKYGLTPTSDGFELAISPIFEANIFRSVVTKVPAKLAQVKGVLVYGQDSDVLHVSDRRWWQRNLPQFSQVEFAGSHLFPLEAPEQVAVLLRELIHNKN